MSSSSTIRYIAFLRAINVAGHTIVKMADLNRVFNQAGCSNVRTVIQSGNVLFEAATSDIDGIARKVQRNLVRMTGAETTILFRPFSEIDGLVSPFKEFGDEPGFPNNF